MIKKYIIYSIIILLSINYIDIGNSNSNTDKQNVKPIPIIDTTSSNSTKKEQFEIKNLNSYNLLIPKINLNAAVYENTNVNTGISILEQTNNIVIIGAHSGIGNLAYFNDLDKLEHNDKIIFNNIIYNVIDIYLDNKTGTLNLNFNNTSNYVVLTTCSQKYNNMQLVVIAEKNEL